MKDFGIEMEDEYLDLCEKCGSGKEVHRCKRCEELFCEDCSAQFNQFTQIDYNCCESCSKQNY